MLEPMEACKPINTDDVKSRYTCPGNGAVMCFNQTQCFRCGWNPDVAAARLEQIKHGLEERSETK